MKYSSFFCLAFITFVALFMSCDQVDVDNRYIVVAPPGPDTTVIDTTDTGGVVTPIYHSTLVEEFSGQLCVNCPAASEALEIMQEANGGPNRVIVVSIHAGENMMLAIGKERGEAMGIQGLATDFGEQLFSNYGLTSEPNAVIDRTSGVIGQAQWLTTIVNSLRRETTVSLSARTSYNEADRTLTVDVLGSSTQAFTGNVHVWLTEDSIVSIQRLPNGYDNNHRFNNIFRASATPISGEQVTIPFGDEQQVIYSVTMTLDAVWRPEHMAVVAFVDNASGVAQATRTAVLSESPVD